MSAYFFGRVTLAGLVLNFVAIPAMAVTQVAGMAAPAAWPSCPLRQLAWPGGVASRRSRARRVRLDRLGVDTFRGAVARPSTLAIVAYYAAALTAWCVAVRLATSRVASRASVRALVRVAVALTVRQLSGSRSQPWTLLAVHGDGRLHVTFVDVGQGDAAFVRFPRGGTMLVDAGGSRVESLRRRRSRRRTGAARGRRSPLDTLVLTHGDADHVGGAASMLSDFATASTCGKACRCRACRSRGAPRGRRRGSARDGPPCSDDDSDGLSTMCRCSSFIRSYRTGSGRSRATTTRSCSSCDGATSRSCSPATSAARWSRRSPRFEPAPLRVLKVPHHGSLTSSSEAVRAQAASAGGRS